MTDNFKEIVESQRADADTLQQALRYYLARRLDDMTPEEMMEALRDQVGIGEEELTDALQRLSSDPPLLENASLLVLASVWEEGPVERTAVEEVIDDAKGKLPVVEVSILAVVAIYGLYLWRTGGIARSEKVVERKPDGSLVEREVVEYASVDAPLGAITRLFSSTP